MRTAKLVLRLIVGAAIGATASTIWSSSADAAVCRRVDCAICFTSDGNCDATDVWYDCIETESGCQTRPGTGCNDGCEMT